jgi:hypothetical protein
MDSRRSSQWREKQVSQRSARTALHTHTQTKTALRHFEEIACGFLSPFYLITD